MPCTVTSIEMREALFHSKSHYINNSLTMMSTVGVFISIIECAIPFKVSKKVSVKTSDDINNNIINSKSNCKRAGFECSICLRNVDDLPIVAGLCGHWFCFDCIVRWHAQRKSCPLCNLTVNPNSLFQIYLP